MNPTRLNGSLFEVQITSGVICTFVSANIHFLCCKAVPTRHKPDVRFHSLCAVKS